MESDEESVGKLDELLAKPKCEDFDFQDKYGLFIDAEETDSSDEDKPQASTFFDTSFAAASEQNTINLSDFIDDFSSIDYSDINPVLTPYEQTVIDECTDPELKELLILNRKKNTHITETFLNVRQVIKQLEEQIFQLESPKYRHVPELTAKDPELFSLAAPYFKIKNGPACLPNMDVVLKRNLGELPFYKVIEAPPKWSRIECDRLLNAIKITHRMNLQRLLNRTDPDDEETVEYLEQEIELSNRVVKVPPVYSDEGIDWYHIAMTYFKDKYLWSECKSMWHLIVHPSINTQTYTEQETKLLRRIAKKYNEQNWNLIAMELNTNRSPFMLCSNYFSKLMTDYNYHKFTPEEDELLLILVDKSRIGNKICWGPILHHFSGCHRMQLYHRYHCYLSQKTSKKDIVKGRFSDAEDVLLLILVNKFGKRFTEFSEYIPNRLPVQIRNRYYNTLERDLIKGSFNNHDDQEIMDHVKKYGPTKWDLVGQKINRRAPQLRQRYKFLKKYLDEHPKETINSIPKYRYRFDKESSKQLEFKRMLANQYKDLDNIPTLEMIEDAIDQNNKPRRFVKKEPGQRMQKPTVKLDGPDEMLIDYFASTAKLKTQTELKPMNFREAAESLGEIFNLLGFQLELPLNFEKDSNLDKADVEILKEYAKQSKKQQVQSNNDKLMAPNVCNLIGLRGLLIKHKSSKRNQADPSAPGCSKNDMGWQIEQTLSKLDEETRKSILEHREIFSDRFDTLFKWCAILSLIEPAKNAEVQQEEEVDSKPLLPKRTLDATLISELQQKGKVIKLDKDMLDKLKKTNPNVIQLEIPTVQQSNDVVRKDVEKLDLLLSSAKRAKIVELPEENIKSDVDKLDEILNKSKNC